MRIEIKQDEKLFVIENEELNNDNFVDVVLYSDLKKDKDNPLGYVSDVTVPLDEILSAVQAFKTLKDERKEV